MLQSYIAVGLGGSIGAVLRYAISSVLMERFNGAFPYGTFVVNLVGAFLLGFFYDFALARTTLGADVRLLISVGFLGAFTTFSTFARETVVFLQEGNMRTALVYSGGSVVGGIAMVAAGMLLAGALSAR